MQINRKVSNGKEKARPGSRYYVIRNKSDIELLTIHTYGHGFLNNFKMVYHNDPLLFGKAGLDKQRNPETASIRVYMFAIPSAPLCHINDFMVTYRTAISKTEQDKLNIIVCIQNMCPMGQFPEPIPRSYHWTATQSPFKIHLCNFVNILETSTR